ncbi:MAG: glycosyltransferase [Cryobacterium sp.]|nr:glycosyltransferase [Cryobacterium sp.]
MTAAPEVLVVLPTLGDRLDTLRQTLDSVQEQRAEVALTLVVVVPEQATAARELAARYDAVIVSDPKTGISAAINCGIDARTTEPFYAWIGDDDLFRPHGLRTLLDLITQTPRAVVAYGGCEYIDAHGEIQFTSAAGGAALFLLPWGPDLIPHPGSMIRIDDLDAIGRYDTSLKFALDLDVFLKLRRRGRFVHTRRVVSAFRWHADSLTVSDRKGSSSEAEAVKRRNLPRALRPLSPLWNRPVSWAASVAARRLSVRSKSA